MTKLNKAVADTFQKIARGSRTGGLLCEASDAKRILYFRDGAIVGARTNVAIERLGRLLLARGRLTKDQLIETTEFVRSGRKLGEVMVELGFLKEGEIDEFVRLQISEIAAAALLTRPTKVVFSKKLGVHATTTRPVGVVEALLLAVSKLPDVESYASHFEGKLISLSDHAELPEDLPTQAAAVVDALNLFPTSLEQLAAATGQELNDVLATVVGLDRCQLLELLDDDDDAGLGLSLDADLEEPFAPPKGEAESMPEADAVAVDEAQTAGDMTSTESALASDEADFDVFTGDNDLGDLFGARPERREPRPPSVPEPACSDEGNPGRPAPPEAVVRRVEAIDRLIHDNASDYHILGIEVGAAKSEVLHAFHGLCGELHPDLHQQVGDEAFHSKLGSVFARITEAFQALSRRPKTPSAPVPEAAPTKVAEPEADTSNAIKDPEQAQQIFALAKRAFHQADFWNAIQLCRRAIAIGNDEAEYYFVLGQALAQNPRWRQDAEQQMKTATTLAPWNAKYLVGLGELYRTSGMDSRAKRMFAEAKSIDPDVKIPKDKSQVQADESSELKAFGISLPLGRTKAG